MGTAIHNANTTLRTLKDSDLTTRDPKEDVRGRKVVDAAGQEIGKVDEILIDEKEQKARFIRVASGGFLGMGRSHALIPIEAIATMDNDVIHLDQTREHVAGRPIYDPKLMDENYLAQVYGHYRYSPYWSPGYLHPRHPH
ncbi:MAG: PRC-barrel domain-containing protein [Kofleriaceae bacterium]